MTLTFNFPEQKFQMNNCSKLFWNPCINVQAIVWKSSIYDHFLILTFKSDPNLQPTWTNVSNGTSTPQGQQLCQIIKLFWNPCINAQLTAQSSVYDHFLIWPSRVTSTINLPEQMFQTALLLLQDNNCAKLFWNTCINVQVMADWCTMHA